MFRHADSEDADLSLRWAHRSFCWFCHAVAHLMISGVKLCGPIQTNLTGTLASVDKVLNRYYDHNVMCTWEVLIQPYDKKIQLYFLDIAFQPTENCQQGFIKVV